MADLARATRWVGTLSDCACQISWWSVEKWYYILKFHGNTFRWPTTLDLKFWKYLSSQSTHTQCYVSFMWSVEKWLRYYILRKHGQTHKQTNTQTNTQTDMGITIPRPPPMGGEVITCSYLVSLWEPWTGYISCTCRVYLEAHFRITLTHDRKINWISALEFFLFLSDLKHSLGIHKVARSTNCFIFQSFKCILTR